MLETRCKKWEGKPSKRGLQRDLWRNVFYEASHTGWLVSYLCGGRDRQTTDFCNRKNLASRNIVHDGLNRGNLKQMSLPSKLPAALEIYVMPCLSCSSPFIQAREERQVWRDIPPRTQTLLSIRSWSQYNSSRKRARC